MRLSWHKLATCAVAGLLAVALTQTVLIAHEPGESDSDEGTVIRVGPERGANDPLPGELNPVPNMRGQFQPYLLPGHPADAARQRRPVSPYYIGVAAKKVDEALRSHVELPDGVGLVLQRVFDGSPADDGGLEDYDILVSADGKDLRELGDLIKVVDDHADGQMTQFTLSIIRHGQPQTVWVTPAQRPQPDPRAVAPPQEGAQQPMFDHRRQPPGGMNLGGVRPRILDMPGFNPNQMPGNVSVKIERKGNGPAHIVVQRDGQKWEVVGDDPESIKELPEDLRPMVEAMLYGQQDMQMFQFNSAPPGGMPRDMPLDMQKRLEQMEQQMREMRQQMHNRTDVPSVNVER